MYAHEKRILISVGQINVVWDEIDFLLWYVFDVLLNVRWKESYAIFYSQQNSRNRREMIASLAKIVLADKQDELKLLTKLLDRVRRASTKRNDLAHGIWTTQKKGRSTLIKRIPIKRDLSILGATDIGEEELSKIHRQLISVYHELYDYIIDRWHKKNGKRLIKSTDPRKHGFDSAMLLPEEKGRTKIGGNHRRRTKEIAS